jgi:hypothetical protein
MKENPIYMRILTIAVWVIVLLLSGGSLWRPLSWMIFVQ